MTAEVETTIDPSPNDTCPLAPGQQTRNLVLFGINTALFYLASPVLLVGPVQAALCKDLQASDTISNLPGSAYLVMAAAPVVVAWLFPQVSLLKRILVVSYAILAIMGAAVAAVLVMPSPRWARIAMVIFQGAVTGGALTVATMFMFEVLQRGVNESRRGTALGLAYGLGPLLAVAGSLLSQRLLLGNDDAPDPANSSVRFAILFAATVPVMGLAAVISGLLIIPLPQNEQSRQPFLQGVFGGLGRFLGTPLLLGVTVIAILVFSAYEIVPNMTLYTQIVLGQSPKSYVGYQLALRFGFKVASGLLAGWLLSRTSPRLALVLTGSFGLAGNIWALAIAGKWFLVGFGFVGAGELFGVYVTNYILCCSSKANTRRNMGFASMMMVPAAPAGALFGAISDYFKETDPGHGFRLSFAVAAVFIGLALAMVLFLPARPRPVDDEEESTSAGATL